MLSNYVLTFRCCLQKKHIFKAMFEEVYTLEQVYTSCVNYPNFTFIQFLNGLDRYVSFRK